VVAELVSSEDGERLLAGHRAYVSCRFCDLRWFTSFAETDAPEELSDVLRDYHGALGQLIPSYGGTLEHFAGDGVMVFFNDPLLVADHELEAIRLAVAAQEQSAELGPRMAKARNRARSRDRHRGWIRDALTDRLRGPLRLWRGRAGDEPRLPAQQPRGCVADPDRATCVRGCRGCGDRARIDQSPRRCTPAAYCGF
jgi:class 3 adenylate cyclase